MLSSSTNEAREEIMRSIRSHLAASVPHDAQEIPIQSNLPQSVFTPSSVSVVDVFQRNLEAVDGHCIIVHGEGEIAAALMPIIEGQRVAISDAPLLRKLIDGAVVTPPAKDLFGFDVGITTAQAGIAETGTLVLDAAFEQHRLVSLVPPVHIAILDASRIYLTLGEALAELQKAEELSPTVTLVTGPSRTADIELTLAIGVHGPQELYVIIHEGSAS